MKFLKSIIKWTLICGVVFIAGSLIWHSSLTEEEKIKLAEEREAREERRKERKAEEIARKEAEIARKEAEIARKETEQKEAQEQKVLSSNWSTFEEKLTILSSYEDVTYFSCPEMRVTKADACGYARELRVLGKNHCGDGYRPNQDLGDYFVVLGKSNSDQDYQRGLIVDVSPKTGKISSSGGVVTAEIKTYNDSSFYSFAGVKLDRRTLVLNDIGSLTRYAYPEDYGIVERFLVNYSYEAETKCSRIGDGNSITNLINDASLRRQDAEKQRLQLEQEKKERLIREKQETEEAIRSKNKI